MKKTAILTTTLFTIITATGSAFADDGLIGTGGFLSVATDKTSAHLGLEGDVGPLFGEYQFRSGGGIGVYPNTTIWRLKIHWIGLGVHVYRDKNDTLSVPFIPRKWDFMPVTGFDVRIWKGMEIRAMAAWHFPNPNDVDKEARRQIDATVKNAPQQTSQTNDAQSVKKKAKDLENRLTLLRESYKSVAKRPHVWIGIRWEF